MTSIEVPYSIAAALPTLSVMDITNEVVEGGRDARAGRDGIAYVTATERALARPRAGARDRLLRGPRVPARARRAGRASPSRERLVHALLGSRTEQVPFSEGCLCLGQWQRIMLFSLDAEHRTDWSLTLLG